MTEQQEIQQPILVIDANFFINKSVDINKYNKNIQYQFYTTQSIINEIIDADARQKLEQFQQFQQLHIQQPEQSYISKIKQNAINCGEIISIGQNDIEILALTLQLTEQYDKEYQYQPIERLVQNNGIMYDYNEKSKSYEQKMEQEKQKQKELEIEREEILKTIKKKKKSAAQLAIEKALYGEEQQENEPKQVEQQFNQPSIQILPPDDSNIATEGYPQQQENEQDNSNKNQEQQTQDDEQGWVTADNIHLLDEDILIQTEDEEPHKVSLFTLDNAMQNVALQLKLKLATSNNQTIKSTQQYVLKCSACRAIFTNIEYVLSYHRNKNFNTQIFNPNNLVCPECAHHCLMRISMYVSEKGITFSKGIKNFRDGGKVNYAIMASKKWSQMKNKYLLNPELYEDKMLQTYQPTKQQNINFDAYVQGTNSNLQNNKIPYWMKKRSKGAKHGAGVN